MHGHVAERKRGKGAQNAKPVVVGLPIRELLSTHWPEPSPQSNGNLRTCPHSVHAARTASKFTRATGVQAVQGESAHSSSRMPRASTVAAGMGCGMHSPARGRLYAGLARRLPCRIGSNCLGGGGYCSPVEHTATHAAHLLICTHTQSHADRRASPNTTRLVSTQSFGNGRFTINRHPSPVGGCCQEQ